MTLVLLLILYGLAVLALTLILLRFGVPPARAILFSHLLYGAVAGILAVILWPADSTAYPNALATWMGDWIYVHAIEFMGDSHFAQAHYTIPWLLRVPQVYALSSCVLCGTLGIAVQWLYNRRWRGGIRRQARLLSTGK